MTLFKPQRSPDVAPAISAPETKHEPLHTRIVPRKDDDIANVSQGVNNKWLATPAITLVWMQQSEFATIVETYVTELDARKSSGGSRSPVTDQLDTIDAQIDDGAREVKTYIADKFGATHATANYAPFGIVHEHKRWTLPHDHDQRSSALKLMIAAIAANGFDTKTFGTAFWTDIKTQFDTVRASANTIDDTTTGSVSNKNVARTQIRNVLHSILLVLEANYPDTFEATRLEWGFKKRNY